MNLTELQRFFERPEAVHQGDPAAPEAHEALLRALESGELRAAVRGEDGRWRALPWVKGAILSAFRRAPLMVMEGPGFPCFDKTAFPPRRFAPEDRVRLVPGGSAVRRWTAGSLSSP